MSTFVDGRRDRPRARAKGLLSEQVDGDLVLYDEVSKTAHSLSADATLVWGRCDGRSSRTEIASAVGLPQETVDRAVDEFRGAGLLAEEQGYTRRDAGKRFAAVGGATFAASALVSTVNVPAALAACSQHLCMSSAAFADWDPMKGPFPENMWFRSDLDAISGTVDTSTVMLVTGSISLPNLKTGPVTVTMVPMRLTFINAAPGTPVTLTYKTDPSLFGGAVFGDEVVPLACANSQLFFGGVMYNSPDAMTPGGPKDWTWTRSVTIQGTSPTNLRWEFGASGYHGPGGTAATPVMSAADYNALAVNPASGGCTTLPGPVSAPSAIAADNDTGSGSGGGLIGSNSGQINCAPVCS